MVEVSRKEGVNKGCRGEKIMERGVIYGKQGCTIRKGIKIGEG